MPKKRRSEINEKFNPMAYSTAVGFQSKTAKKKKWNTDDWRLRGDIFQKTFFRKRFQKRFSQKSAASIALLSIATRPHLQMSLGKSGEYVYRYKYLCISQVLITTYGPPYLLTSTYLVFMPGNVRTAVHSNYCSNGP